MWSAQASLAYGGLACSDIAATSQVRILHLTPPRHCAPRPSVEVVQRSMATIYGAMLATVLVVLEILVPTRGDVIVDGKKTGSSNVEAIFTFGDSIVDAGNSNYLVGQKSAVLKANFVPYGIDFTDQKPTGRHSNGRTIVDFLATSINLRFALPSRCPGVNASSPGGLNFAYAGSGILDSTNRAAGTVSLMNQIAEYQKVQNDHQQAGRALYCIVSGSNDLLGNYLLNTTLQSSVTPADFIGDLVETMGTAIKTLYELGARKFVVVSLGPLGCAPEVLVAANHSNGDCLAEPNALAATYNDALRQLVKSLQLPGATVVVTLVYDVMSQLIENSAGGFASGSDACCGGGPLHAVGRCGINPSPNQPAAFSVCGNRENHFFWDLIHPTEHVYRYIANMMWQGDTSVVEPINIRSLAQL